MMKKQACHLAAATLAVFVGTAATASEIPKFTRIALMGDSITELNGDGSTYLRRGLWSDFSSALHQQVDLVCNGTVPGFATAGYRVRQIQSTYLPKVLASNAQACIVLAGTNDGDTVDNIAALKEIATSLADHCITPILCDVLPIDSGLPARSAALVSMKSSLAAVCDADPRFIHLDWFNVLDANNDGVIDQSWYYVADGAKVHPDADGMSRLAAYAAQRLAPFVQPRDFMAEATLVSPDPGLSGPETPPANWGIYPGTGISVAAQSKLPRGDGQGNWWQLRLAGADPSQYALLALGVPLAPTGLSAGDAVELVVEYQTDADVSAAWNLKPILTAYPSLLRRVDGNIDGSSVTGPLRAAEGLLRTPQMLVPAGTTDLNIVLQVNGTGTFRIGRVGVRKVPLTFATWITGFPGLVDLSAEGDPDHDGVSNRLEWILGGNPAVPEVTPLNSMKGGVFRFRQTPRSQIDCDLSLEHSTGLNLWQRLPVTANTGGPVFLSTVPGDSSLWRASAPSEVAAFFRLASDWKP